MKPWILAGLLAGGVVAVGSWMRAEAVQRDPDRVAMRAFMRGKLEASENVLEGLVTEDFELIAQGADKMRLMSKRLEWNVIKTERYAEYSDDFQRQTDKLSKAGRAKKIDAAALAWMQVAMTCVNCHEHARGVRVAGADGPLWSPPNVSFAKTTFARTAFARTAADRDP